MPPPQRRTGGGGIIVIFNMNPGLPTEGWDQIMTLPRRLTLDAKDEVRVEPAGDIESLRFDHRRIEATVLPANKEVVLGGIEGSALELVFELDPMGRVDGRAQRAPVAGQGGVHPHRLLQGPRVQSAKNLRPSRGRYCTEVTPRYAPVTSRGRSSCAKASSHSTRPTLRRYRGALSRAPETAPVLLEPGEPLQLRVFIDRSVVEVFANGKQCIAARGLPRPP